LTRKEDFQAFYALEHQIVEFASSDHGEKDQVDSLLADQKRGAICVGVYVGDTLVAVASTTADTSLSSMLVGVCTHPDYRQQRLRFFSGEHLAQKPLRKRRAIRLPLL
jgi:predicted GNAT family acetyltransferase